MLLFPEITGAIKNLEQGEIHCELNFEQFWQRFKNRTFFLIIW